MLLIPLSLFNWQYICLLYVISAVISSYLESLKKVISKWLFIYYSFGLLGSKKPKDSHLSYSEYLYHLVSQRESSRRWDGN